jgi:hypothetical protein
MKLAMIRSSFQSVAGVVRLQLNCRNSHEIRYVKIVTWLVIALTLAAPLCSRALASGHGSAKSQDSHSSHDAHGSHGATEVADDSEIGGINLGQYRVRSYYPVEAQKSTVTFALYASTSDEQLTGMKDMVKRHEHRIRDQVTTATRLAPLAEFDQPDLTAFRRRILTRLRRSLPDMQIDDVYISDFQLLVKSL